MNTEEKRKPFHITVTDNETGQTLHDVDVEVIFAFFTDGERTANCINVRSDSLGYANVLYRAELELKKQYSKYPQVKKIVKRFKKEDK